VMRQVKSLPGEEEIPEEEPVDKEEEKLQEKEDKLFPQRETPEFDTEEEEEEDDDYDKMLKRMRIPN